MFKVSNLKTKTKSLTSLWSRRTIQGTRIAGTRQLKDNLNMFSKTSYISKCKLIQQMIAQILLDMKIVYLFQRQTILLCYELNMFHNNEIPELHKRKCSITTRCYLFFKTTSKISVHKDCRWNDIYQSSERETD